MTAKLQKERREHKRGDDSFRYYTEFTVVLKTEAGGKQSALSKETAEGKCTIIWLLVTVFGITPLLILSRSMISQMTVLSTATFVG